MIAALSVLIGTLALIAASPSLRTIHAWWTDPTRRWYRHLWIVDHHLARPPVPWAAAGSTAPSGTEPTPAPVAQPGAGPHVRDTAGRERIRVPSADLTGDSSAVADGVEPPQPAPGITSPGAGPTPPAGHVARANATPSRHTSPAGGEGIPAGSSFLLPGVPLPAGPTTPAPGRAQWVPRPGMGHQRPAAADPPDSPAAGLQPGAVPGAGGAPVVGAGAPYREAS